MEVSMTVKVEAALWSSLLKLKSERASLEAQIEEVQKQLNLPSGADVAAQRRTGRASAADRVWRALVLAIRDRKSHV